MLAGLGMAAAMHEAALASMPTALPASTARVLPPPGRA